VSACTDITGFGLLGHASEMAAGSGRSIEIEASKVPLIPGARELVGGNVPGGGRTNRQHFGQRIELPSGIASDLADLLFDPQTSGGLLVAVHPDHLQELLRRLEAAGVAGAEIGRVAAGANVLIRVR
jgi:selenide,water dikinase